MVKAVQFCVPHIQFRPEEGIFLEEHRAIFSLPLTLRANNITILKKLSVGGTVGHFHVFWECVKFAPNWSEVIKEINNMDLNLTCHFTVVYLCS